MKSRLVLATTLAFVFPVASSAEEPAPASEPKVLVVERVIDAPVERVWAAFTDPEAMRGWMAPHVEVDLRIGGTLKTNYNAEGKIGDANTIVHEVLCYEPLRMLSTQNVKAPADFPFAEGTVGTWSISYFTPLEGGKTKVRLVGLGWPAGEAGDKAYAFFERGNTYCLEVLAKHLAGKQVATPKSDGSDVPEKR